MSALVVGVGDPSRGDDAVGAEVAARVAELDLPEVTVVVHEEPLGLLDQFARYDEVVIVDALAPNGAPGRLEVLVVSSAPLRRTAPAAIGSHGIGVVEVVELARALGQLPSRLTVVGVEADTLDVGASCSAAVRASLAGAVRAVVDALPESGQPVPPPPRTARPRRG